jgi:hypothetical protein
MRFEISEGLFSQKSFNLFICDESHKTLKIG